MKRIEHYVIRDDKFGMWLSPYTQSNVRVVEFLILGFYDGILCGDPIGAPSGAQLSTEAESDIERDRR